MQFWIPPLLALAGTSLAAPTSNSNYKDTEVKVILDSSLSTSFGNRVSHRETKRPASHGPFSTVELSVGKNFPQQALRCQILDHHHQPVVIVRGENIDTTFSDAEKGLWTFRDGQSRVSRVVCDPTFVANPQAPKDTSVIVQLTGPSELATQTPFSLVGAQGGSESQTPIASSGPYNSVSLTLGPDVENQALRCWLMDKKGEVIVLKRGENVQRTFAKGEPWSFLEPRMSEVGKIECNDQFVLGSQ